MQAVFDVQDTLKRTFDVDPAGLGVGSTAHLLPSHRSAKPACTPEASVELPTAVQARGEVQETPYRTLSLEVAG